MRTYGPRLGRIWEGVGPMEEAAQRLLKKLKAEENQGLGRLKIFFGYAAGVGKTYAMLEAAHAAMDAGVDVVAGYIEPHQRPATQALMQGLEALPFLQVPYHGVTLREFDLDAALARHPQLCLVDELAHSNAEGCRHKKRYQDIEELLAAGISVYTTVNVQHLESLNDIVQSITGIAVRERVPDFVFDTAGQVELVDVEPEVLLERLQAGRIYRQDAAQRAMQNFFTKDKLIALRELALRRTADRVSAIVEREKDEDAGYYTDEHILVCLSSAPTNAKVIRSAARLAAAFHARFTALFVETPGTRELKGEHRDKLRENLRLAETLGARVATVYGTDVPQQIAEYAKVSGVSKIVLGRTGHGGTKTDRIFRRQALVEKLCALAPNLDVYVIPDHENQSSAAGPRRKLFTPKVTRTDAAATLGILAVATVLSELLRGFSESNTVAVYMLATFLISTLTGSHVCGIFAAVASVALFNFLFTPPLYTFEFSDPGALVTFLTLLVTGVVTATLASRVRSAASLSAMNAHRTEVLLETSQKLQQCASREESLDRMGEQLVQLLDRAVSLYAVEGNDLGEARCYGPQAGIERLQAKGERAVAQWVYRNNKHAGRGTSTLPAAKGLYLAVRTGGQVFAVAGIAMEAPDDLPAYERSLLLAMLAEFALALERRGLDEGTPRG